VVVAALLSLATAVQADMVHKMRFRQQQAPRLHQLHLELAAAVVVPLVVALMKTEIMGAQALRA
jgi:hypothetical protein